MGFGGSKQSSNSGGGGQSNFSRIGSVTLTKSAAEKLGSKLEETKAEIKNSELKMTLGFYLPKGVKELTITNDTKLYLSFEEVEGAPEFVLGRILIPNS